MRLLAISDLHLSNTINRDALQQLPASPSDWLILAGDIAERYDQVRATFETLAPRFARLIWVPGNHDLWTMPGETCGSGRAKYEALVALARSYGIATPEDDFLLWTGPGGPCLIVPMFLLYDYSFRPKDVALADVVAWATAENAVCADEMLLDPAPYADRAAWCAERCRLTEARLKATGTDIPLIMINHYPLREDLINIPRIPRFSPWCGTRQTEDWHTRFNARVVVSGHLHTRRTDWRDGTRFEEVSLGYPRQWDQTAGVQPYLREILPGPGAPS